jgi:hypothetical protein
MSSYQRLSPNDPEEHKKYGSVASTPDHCPLSALLVTTQDLDEFEKLQNSNPFLDPEVAAYWRGVYDNCKYECRDAFNPTLTWSKREEQEIIQKLDWKVCLWAVCHAPETYTWPVRATNRDSSV